MDDKYFKNIAQYIGLTRNISRQLKTFEFVLKNSDKTIEKLECDERFSDIEFQKLLLNAAHRIVKAINRKHESGKIARLQQT